MSRILPRFYRHTQAAEDNARIARILLETGAHAPEPVATRSRATLPGDTRRLRGIPVVGRGIPGTSPGTDPSAIR